MLKRVTATLVEGSEIDLFSKIQTISSLCQQSVNCKDTKSIEAIRDGNNAKRLEFFLKKIKEMGCFDVTTEND